MQRQPHPGNHSPRITACERPVCLYECLLSQHERPLSSLGEQGSHSFRLANNHFDSVADYEICQLRGNRIAFHHLVSSSAAGRAAPPWSSTHENNGDPGNVRPDPQTADHLRVAGEGALLWAPRLAHHTAESRMSDRRPCAPLQHRGRHHSRILTSVEWTPPAVVPHVTSNLSTLSIKCPWSILPSVPS